MEVKKLKWEEFSGFSFRVLVDRSVSLGGELLTLPNLSCFNLEGRRAGGWRRQGRQTSAGHAGGHGAPSSWQNASLRIC